MIAMRSVAISLLTGLAVAVGQSSGQAPAKGDGQPEPPRVIATATAAALVKPDSARITFAVNSHEPIERSAREANEKQIKKIRDALTALPLNKTQMDIQVVPNTVGLLVTGAQNTGGPTVQSRKAQSLFQVTVRDADFDKLRDAVSRIIESAVENGGTTSGDSESRHSFRIPRFVAGGNAEEEPEAVAGPTVEWLASATDGPRREAIRKATKDAIADAEAAVGTAKLQVVEVMVSSSETASNRLMRYAVSEDSPTPAGLVRVAVEVRVTCTY